MIPVSVELRIGRTRTGWWVVKVIDGDGGHAATTESHTLRSALQQAVALEMALVDEEVAA